MKIRLWLSMLMTIGLLTACMPVLHREQTIMPDEDSSVTTDKAATPDVAPATSLADVEQSNKNLEEEQYPEEEQVINSEYEVDGLVLDSEIAPSHYELQRGSGEFYDHEVATRLLRQAVAEGDVTLNFEAAEIQEVIRVILGDMLEQNYAIGPGVKGKVSFSTARPVTREQLLPILETILGWNKSAMVYRDGRYLILPLGQVIPGNLTPHVGPLPTQGGYEVQIMPLDYITPSEMQKLLKPFAHNDAFVRVDDQRRLMILAGTAPELKRYSRTIKIFDVDWLAGMSVEIFPVEQVDAKTVLTELETLLGAKAKGGSPIAGMIRFMLMERLNAIVAITPQAAYLDQIYDWITRLDQNSEQAIGVRLYVYNVANVDAAELASTLNDLFSGSGGSSSSTKTFQTEASGAVAPGLAPVEITSINDPRNEQEQESSVVEQRSVQAANADTGITLVASEDIRITSIAESNALLIRATSWQYEFILEAIKKLDVLPLQVLIEAKVIEVSLTGSLSYGVEWFFKNAVEEQFPDVTNGTIFESGTAGIGGLSYSLANIDVGFIISALQTAADTELLSAPTLMVLNNEQATINVGTQIPVNTTTINTGDTTATTTSVQFRNTGVTLNVTPRINPGGLVFMDISQSVTSALPGTDSNGNVSISQRTVDTKVAVQDGQTVILGGLISDQLIQGDDGVPFLSKIPVLGALFGTQNDSTSRTELVIFITPRVIHNQKEADEMTEDYQKQFEHIRPFNLVPSSLSGVDRTTSYSHGEEK